MHVVFVTAELATSENSVGGVGSFTANMARIFTERGHKVSIVVLCTKEDDIKFDDGIDIYKTLIKLKLWKILDVVSKIISKFSDNNHNVIRRFLMNICKSKQVKNIIKEINKKEKIDIIHYCHLRGCSLKANYKIPYVVRLSSINNISEGGAQIPNGSLKYEDNPLNLQNKLEEYTLKRARYVISPSIIYANICRDNINRNVTVIESPYMINELKWNYEKYNELSMDGKRYIIYYGTMNYLKGIHVIAGIVQRLLGEFTDVCIILAGKSDAIEDENGILKKAHELVVEKAEEYSDRVIYVGRLPREQLFPFVRNAELCLFPSRIENLSNACIEAMAMGKIVVATNGASYEQLIEDGVSGFLCERDNPDSFLNGIDRALGMSENEKIKMSQKAVEVTKRLSPDNIYEKYLEYYQKVIREWGK